MPFFVRSITGPSMESRSHVIARQSTGVWTPNREGKRETLKQGRFRRSRTFRATRPSRIVFTFLFFDEKIFGE